MDVAIPFPCFSQKLSGTFPWTKRDNANNAPETRLWGPENSPFAKQAQPQIIGVWGFCFLTALLLIHFNLVAFPIQVEYPNVFVLAKGISDIPIQGMILIVITDHELRGFHEVFLGFDDARAHFFAGRRQTDEVIKGRRILSGPFLLDVGAADANEANAAFGIDRKSVV